MHVIVCCIIAVLLLDAVVAINIYVFSKAKSVISAKDHDSDFYRVKITPPPEGGNTCDIESTKENTSR
ncbi:hypothetical protein Plhal304r1_c024g0081821 [Plasmopara halstedii]